MKGGRGAARSKPSSTFSASSAAKPLPVRWALPDAQPAVGRADRLVPSAVVACEIFDRQAAARSLDGHRDRFSDLALIEGRLSPFGYRAESAGEARVAEDLAGPRRPAVDRQLTSAGRLLELSLGPSLPEVGRDRRGREAFFCQADGGCEYAAQRQAPVPFVQVTPARACARNGDGVGVEWRQLAAEPLLLQARQGKRRRRAARAVQRGDLSVGGLVVEGEAIPADAGGGRLGDVQGCGGRHGSIGSIPARGQDFQPGGHGQRLRGGDHAAAAVDGGAAGRECHAGHASNLQGMGHLASGFESVCGIATYFQGDVGDKGRRSSGSTRSSIQARAVQLNRPGEAKGQL